VESGSTVQQSNQVWRQSMKFLDRQDPAVDRFAFE